MICILVGDDTNKKNDYIRELTRGRESFLVPSSDLNKNLILSYSTNINLFGEPQNIIVENILKDNIITFLPEELILLKESETIFLFKEDKLSVSDQKKYKKYADVKVFEDKNKQKEIKFNIFSITDAFASKDKISTWTLYNKAIIEGIEPEAISGVLFWKIKNMLLTNSRSFSKEDLKKQSSSIVSLYHKAHRGEIDFTIGLEQFILSSLSTK